MRRKMIKVVALPVGLLVISGLAYAIIFPQASRCVLVAAYGFQNDGNLYYRPGLNHEKVMAIKSIIRQAEDRNAVFWGKKTGNPTYIYCDSDEDYRKFGSPMMTPAAAHLTFNSFVVFSQNGINVDIAAHEIAHTELYTRVGVLNRALKIPIWFDEGLAMQLDHRHYYSLDTLAVRSGHFKDLPEVTKMDTKQFFTGTKEQAMLNYMTAKYEVNKWYTLEKLEKLIWAINHGSDFETAFRK